MIVRSCSLLSPTRLRFAKAPSPASGRGKNHTPRILKWKMENNKRRWLWVPAFAGTTRGEVPRTRRAFPHPPSLREGTLPRKREREESYAEDSQVEDAEQ